MRVIQRKQLFKTPYIEANKTDCNAHERIESEFWLHLLLGGVNGTREEEQERVV